MLVIKGFAARPVDSRDAHIANAAMNEIVFCAETPALK
jgi:hypothetical protein